MLKRLEQALERGLTITGQRLALGCHREVGNVPAGMFRFGRPGDGRG